MDESKLIIFEGNKIRRVWYKEDWNYSVVDVIFVLTGSKDPKGYLKDMRRRDVHINEGWGQIATPLRIETSGGIQRINCANKEGIFRIIQSIPSKRAEPFKLWLAKVGSERIDEIDNPELSIDRAMNTYLKKGYDKKWINQRLKSIEVRKDLTDEWERVGVETNREFAILTDEITHAWSGKSISDYKEFKNLKRESLRDNMTNLELVLNMLAEATTTEISKKEDPEDFDKSLDVANRGGTVAGNARRDIENEIGEGIVSSNNYKKLKGVDEKEKIILKVVKKKKVGKKK
jgi:hypothetical protein